MSEKHSPGPWRECAGFRMGCICGLVWTVPGDHPVATAYQGGDDDFAELPPDIMKANARLIAAAPELLALARYAAERGEGVAEMARAILKRIDGE